MAKETKNTLIHEVAEGSAADYERIEPNLPRRTATTPAVVLESTILASKTGALPPFMEVEGTDKAADVRESKPNVAEETAPTPPSPDAKAKLVAAASERTTKPNVLIIEDTFELAEVIQATLENAGMNAESVSHGGKGLELLKNKTPDVLLLDIGLPDMTGWKMLEELREFKKQREDNMPTVIVITAYGDPANRLIGKLQGIHSYLIKPFTADEVEKVVRGALSSSA